MRLAAISTSITAACLAVHAVGDNVLTENLAELDLVSFEGFQSINNGRIAIGDGSSYAVADFKPYTELFSSDFFDISADATVAIHKSSGRSFPLSVFRVVDNNQTIVQVTKDQSGSITYGEVRQSTAGMDTFFVPASINPAALSSENDASFVNGAGEVLMSFTTADMDRAKLAESFDLGEAPPIHGGPIQFLTAPADVEQAGNNNRKLASGQCSYYQVVPVALVYDSTLCGVYGSKQNTESRLMTIASSASALYERDMCVRLELTDIYTPDPNCGGSSPTFRYFYFDNACSGSRSLLDDFTAWTREEREKGSLARDALTHLFTGVSRPTNSKTIGCAWIGVLCLERWSVGVEYLTFSSSIVSQTLVFAHEVGHNLGARHMPDASGNFNYVMEALMSTGADGFSQETIDTVQAFMNSPSVDCDYRERAPPSPTPRPAPKPSPRPTPRPSRQPTRRPTPKPTRRPTPRPTSRPIIRPTPRPTPRPTRRPTPRPTRRPTPRPTRRPTPGPRPTPRPTRRPVPPEEEEDTVCPVPVELSLCLVKHDDHLFSCFPKDELLPAACPRLGITFEITRCDGLAVDNHRNLKKMDEKNKMKTNQDEQESTVAADAALQARDCDTPCIVMEDQVCFNGSTGNHFFTFFAVNTRGERVGHLNRRRVAGYSRDLGGCRSATLACVK